MITGPRNSFPYTEPKSASFHPLPTDVETHLTKHAPRAPGDGGSSSSILLPVGPSLVFSAPFVLSFLSPTVSAQDRAPKSRCPLSSAASRDLQSVIWVTDAHSALYCYFTSNMGAVRLCRPLFGELMETILLLPRY